VFFRILRFFLKILKHLITRILSFTRKTLNLVSKFIKIGFSSSREARFIENKQSFLTRILKKIKNKKPDKWVNRINKSCFTHTYKTSACYKTLASIIINASTDNLEKNHAHQPWRSRIKHKFYQENKSHDEIFCLFQRQIIDYQFNCELNINKENPFELILQTIFFILFCIFFEIFQIAESAVNEISNPKSI